MGGDKTNPKGLEFALVECKQCGCKKTADMDMLMISGDGTLSVRRDYRCDQCGSKSLRLIPPTKIGEGGGEFYAVRMAPPEPPKDKFRIEKTPWIPPATIMTTDENELLKLLSKQSGAWPNSRRYKIVEEENEL